jgi:hypothetical protein
MLRILPVVLGVCLLINAFGDRKFDPAETDHLLRLLTQQPRRSWLPYGTIHARHLQYQEFENKITDSSEVIHFDGDRYNWVVTLNPSESLDMNRSSTIGPDGVQTPTEDFLMNRTNQYIWNGQKQVRYYIASGYAIVALGQETASSSLFGPPTAGIVPWGHGDCSLAVLRLNGPTVYELNGENGTTVLLEYTETKYRPSAQVRFVLDPSADYAVLSYSIENELALLRNTYSDYQQIGGFRVPRKIMIERFDKRTDPARLISYDDWNFEHIEFKQPAEAVFTADFAPGTVVELQPSQSLKTFMYHAPENQDIEPLLEDKISLLSDSALHPGNCATAAVRHLSRKYGRPIAAEKLHSLVSSDTQTTRLTDLKAALEEAGFECMAVTTDITSLGKFSNCTKIVHLPVNNHYVIVDRIEADSVWVIDLLNRQFYWKKELKEFMQEWTDGTALLVSDSPIDVPLDSRFIYLETAQLASITGGNFGTYSCTDKLQDSEHILCDLPVGFLCSGLYYKIYERYGCKEDRNGGTCVGKMMIGYESTHCINNMNDGCTITGIWQARNIRACK